jgi:chemotaxis protein CheD
MCSNEQRHHGGYGRPWRGEIAGHPFHARHGIAGLLELMARSGAAVNTLSAKIVGGANSLFPSVRPEDTVGRRNVEAVKEILAAKRIRVAAEDTGGAAGRGLVFRMEDGAVKVTVLTQPPKLILL